ncbi:MerR family transcriptional regulator [Aquibacillus sediminis]|uniref:MerR family transcriptional regulator n=1 Tax=Aquibacillus sediminis TaxID=2574734 RepID=UPI0011084A66|nr:MerR family transcriptional regulator [Aquibacillus sediminis]
MNHQNIPNDRAAFPISAVKEWTELSARQIRYYEEQGLVHPKRSEGNRRVYSFNDMKRLKKVKELIDQGINIAGIKAMLEDEQR